MLNRRQILALMAMSAAAPAAAAGTASVPVPKVRFGPSQPFSRASLLERIGQSAAQPYVAPAQVPEAWRKLTYDQYRAIRYKHVSALWRDSDLPFEAEFFPPGLYFPQPVAVSVVDGDTQRPVLFDLDLFDIFGDLPDLPVDETVGFSGLRFNAAINSAAHKSEFAVFQGASYFRAIGRDQIYGLSARGLALDTGEPGGEEFPAFRAFWIEQPQPGASTITVHAHLDSESVAGLYTFVIQPGRSTRMDVAATLFPRRELDHVGLAAQTSMFLFDETNRERFDDFRPAVHDSDGLLIENGAGERLWRQLANPTALQVSSFVDDNPRGFGLMQRPRAFEDFADLEADYHRRPGLWITPGGQWGKGAVTLVEIPADKEIYDNIVAYWRPRQPLSPSRRHDFAWRMEWTSAAPVSPTLARVHRTRMGKSFSGKELAAVDFTGADVLPKGPEDVTVHVSSNGAPVSKGVLQRNPATGGLRLDFTFEPGDRREVELRAQLMRDGQAASEVWLYRWTRP